MKLSNLDLDLRLPTPPMILVSIMVIGAFVPMGIASAIWFKRNYFDPNPRIHIFQDMDNQARGNAQSASEVFTDGRTMRAYAPGTVAWGRTVHQPDPTMLKDDDLAYRGHASSPETGLPETVTNAEGAPTPKFLGGFPDTVKVDYDLLKRGQDMYMTHCYTCHGADGQGMGPTKLAMDVWGKFDANAPADKKSGTTPLVPANLHDLARFGEDAYPNGRIFYTITNGQGTMNALGGQIKAKDRWAIVAYVRAMQNSFKAAQATASAE